MLLSAKPEEQWDERYQVDVALCYLRLGDEASARRIYQNQSLDYAEYLRAADDLPDTTSLVGLETSILLSRGSMAQKEAGYLQAASDYLAAQRLMPGNGYLAFSLAMSLQMLERFADAKKYYELAISIGQGKYVDFSKTELASVSYQLEVQQRQAHK